MVPVQQGWVRKIRLKINLEDLLLWFVILQGRAELLSYVKCAWNLHPIKTRLGPPILLLAIRGEQLNNPALTVTE